MTNNIVLDKDGSNELTIKTKMVEEIQDNKLIVLALPTSTANWGSGPKDAILVDLLRITKRITIDGHITYADRTKFKALFISGGTFTLEYAGEDLTVNMEKMSIREIPQDAGSSNPDYYDVKLTCVIGKDYGS